VSSSLALPFANAALRKQLLQDARCDLAVSYIFEFKSKPPPRVSPDAGVGEPTFASIRPQIGEAMSIELVIPFERCFTFDRLLPLLFNFFIQERKASLFSELIPLRGRHCSS
jgi:hypothetical protein